MAKFYPDTGTDFHGSDGEAEVFQALSVLSDEYAVFHSFRWLGDPRQRRTEGEADFVVLHPRFGILSIEVKAGGISYEDGAWRQTNRLTGEQKRIDPLGQAMESQHRIHRLLGDKYAGVQVGRAAWFISVVLPKQLPLPPECAREILLDQEALDFPQEALKRAFGYWSKNFGCPSQQLSQASFQAMLRLLMPNFHLAETVSAASGAVHSNFVQLTNQQFAVLHFLREQRVAAIHGPAGTGKTLLAVEKARMLAEEGRPVLYLCFNEFLLGHLRGMQLNPLITVHNVRSLAEELLQDDSLALNEVIPFFEEYFACEYDDAAWSYPNIVVDEGQDLSDNLLEHLADLAELADGSFYVFYDRNQYIMRSEKPEWLDEEAECRLVLYRNCRNTAEIAAAISKIMGLKPQHYLNEVHGLWPQVAFCRSAVELEKLATAFVQDMLRQRLELKDIVILSVHSVQHSPLYMEGITKLADVPISLEPQPDSVLFTSVRKFKGLEAKAVLLIDARISELTDRLMQRLLYVGCSRANDYLRVVIRDDVYKDYNYRCIIQELTGVQECKGNRQEVAKALGLEMWQPGRV